MPESYASDRVSDWIKKKIDREIAMTPEERKKAGMRLGKMILHFFEAYPDLINQETVEILGIAVMYFHSYLYHASIDTKEEKP